MSFQTFGPPAPRPVGAEKKLGFVVVVSWLNRREAGFGPKGFESFEML
jgi:hypothetical protein